MGTERSGEKRAGNKFSWACATFLVKHSKLKKVPFQNARAISFLCLILSHDLAETRIRKNYAVSPVWVAQWIKKTITEFLQITIVLVFVSFSKCIKTLNFKPLYSHFCFLFIQQRMVCFHVELPPNSS